MGAKYGYKNRLKPADLIESVEFLDQQPEKTFIEFAQIVEYHKQFEKYLRAHPDYNKINNMQRSKASKKKRRMFAKWYVLMHQNTKTMDQIVSEIAEMSFVHKRTIEIDLYKV